MRFIMVSFAVLLVAACTVRHFTDITATKPVYEVSFSGSHQAFIQCVKTALRGKTAQDPAMKDGLIVYDSEKWFDEEGLTHYAVSIQPTGPSTSRAVFRKLPEGKPMSDRVISRFWRPVERCAGKRG